MDKKIFIKRYMKFLAEYPKEDLEEDIELRAIQYLLWDVFNSVPKVNDANGNITSYEDIKMVGEVFHYLVSHGLLFSNITKGS